MGAIGTVGALLQLRIDANVRTGAVNPESSSCTRWSGIELFDQMLETLLRAMNTLLEAAQSLIRA